MRRVAIICLLAFAFCSVSCSFVFASSMPEEKVYEITERELSQLEKNLNELEFLNEKQQENCEKLEEQLKISQEKSMMLEGQLMKLIEKSEIQEQSLEKANLLLKEYEIEERKKRRRIEFQRNSAYVIASILTYIVILK